MKTVGLNAVVIGKPIQHQSDCNSKIKWVSMYRFCAPDHQLYF